MKFRKTQTGPSCSPGLKGHVVVIGGSMSGLLVSRVLADHFQRVTIVERDRYPLAPQPRSGVPQSRFLHVLLQRGQLILEELFPGLTEELVNHGAPLLDDSKDICFFSQYGIAKKDSSSVCTISPTRALLDWTIRRRLLQRSNIYFLERCQVTGLVATSDSQDPALQKPAPQVPESQEPSHQGIKGVRVQTPEGPQVLRADLVIDASGKTSKAPQWLRALGYDAPQETFIDAHIGYAHRVYERPTQPNVEWQAALVWPNLPHQTRSAILFPVEGDRWIVGLGGAAPDYPPTNEAEFLDYARSLPTLEIYNAIKDASPLSDIMMYKGNENRLRAYEKLSPYPENFLVMGHAACAFNPVYGQGMTMAAIESQILDRALHKLTDDPRPGWSRNIQKQFANAEMIPWSMATEMDQQYITRNQTHTFLERANYWYQSQLLELITHDPDVYGRMNRVNHMLEKPNSLLNPVLLWKILKHQIGRCWGPKELLIKSQVLKQQ